MKNKIKSIIIVAIGLGVSQVGNAYDCNSDCGRDAAFTYRCPTLRNPGRTCEGRNPVIYAACETAKAASCQLWEELLHAYKGRVKSVLKVHFNASAYERAEEEGKEERYMALCEAAGVSVCAAIGAEVGGPYGAALSGAAGVFISYRLCEQSRHW